MDGADDNRNLTLLATTNRVQDLDTALLRPGRFGPANYVDKSDEKQNKAIIEYYKKRYNSTVDAGEIIRSIEGDFSGADIRVAIEDCLMRGVGITTENIIENFRELKVRIYERRHEREPRDRARETLRRCNRRHHSLQRTRPRLRTSCARELIVDKMNMAVEPSSSLAI